MSWKVTETFGLKTTIYANRLRAAIADLHISEKEAAGTEAQSKFSGGGTWISRIETSNWKGDK
jgi:hypothetical protein